MSVGPTITLGGLEVASPREFRWRFRAGVEPVVEAFEVTVTDADKLRQLTTNPRTPVELVIDVPGRKPLKIEYLFIREVRPTSRPHTKLVVVADQRIWWRDQWVKFDFNTRRFTGETFMIGNREELLEPIPDLDYRVFSLDNGQPYTPRRALGLVLLRASGGGRTTRGIRIGAVPNFPIEDGRIDARGDDAVAQTLTQFPGAQVWIDKRGFIRVFDRFKLSKIERNGLEVQGVDGGFLRKVDRSNIMPTNIFVLFDEEIELRFDGLSRITPVSRNTSDRIMHNVIEVPDPELKIPVTVAFDRRNRVVGRGTYLLIEQYIAAIMDPVNGTLPLLVTTGKAPKLTVELLAKNLANGFKYLASQYTLTAAGQTSPVWMMRLNRLMRDVRQLWQIARIWQDTLEYVRPVRVARVSRELGEANRVESPVFVNTTTRPTWYGLGQAALNKLRRRHPYIDQESYPGFGEPLNETRAGPVNLQLVDRDTYTFRLVPRADQWGESEDVILGIPDAAGLKGEVPIQKLGLLNRETAEQASKKALYDWLQMDPTFGFATIITARRGRPNNFNKLRFESVSKSQIENKLETAKLGTATGPAIQVRVREGTMTAKYTWVDGRKGDEITQRLLEEKSFVNAVQLSNKQHVRNVAEAVAASIYLVFQTRFEGTATFDIDPELELEGGIEEITHVVSNRGVARTTISIPPPQRSDSLWRFLPDSTRKHLLNIITP